MQFLDLKACRAWAKSAGFSSRDLRALAPSRKGPSPVTLAPYEDEPMGRAAPLARLVAGFPGIARDGKLLWLTEYGIWPSSENPDLFERLKRSYGEDRPHPDVSGFSFAAAETDAFVNHFQLALMFGWGGYVLTRPGGTNVAFSHDGWFCARSTPGRERKIAAAIADFGFARR